MDSEEDKRNQIRQMGAYLTIPFILAVPPIIGWFIGQWLDQRFETKPYFMYGLILMGFLTGFRELYRIVKRFGDGP